MGAGCCDDANDASLLAAHPRFVVASGLGQGVRDFSRVTGVWVAFVAFRGPCLWGCGGLGARVTL